jgi:dTMP kinase
MLSIHNFLIFEGGDGSGTSTQMDILRKRFTGPPLPPLYATFEPTDGPIGALIRRALKGDPVLQAETIARLFSADRHEHLYGPGGIVERCGRGELVVSDRYAPSSLVYQGIACGEELSDSLNAPFPAPELILFFDLDPAIALRRIASRPDRDIYEYLEFQVKVRNRYKALLGRYEEAGLWVEYIDAALREGEVSEQVWRAVGRMPIMKGENQEFVGL